MQSSSQVTCVCVCVCWPWCSTFTSLCREALLGLFLLKQRVCLGYLEREGCDIQRPLLWSFKINLCHCCCALELFQKGDMRVAVGECSQPANCSGFPLSAENHQTRGCLPPHLAFLWSLVGSCVHKNLPPVLRDL